MISVLELHSISSNFELRVVAAVGEGRLTMVSTATVDAVCAGDTPRKARLITPQELYLNTLQPKQIHGSQSQYRNKLFFFGGGGGFVSLWHEVTISLQEKENFLNKHLC